MSHNQVDVEIIRLYASIKRLEIHMLNTDLTIMPQPIIDKMNDIKNNMKKMNISDEDILKLQLHWDKLIKYKTIIN